MTTSPVPETLIWQQAVKYYLVLVLWPVYLFLLPLVFARLGIFSLLYMIFPGIYLFTWVGFLMHESWHKYIPNIPNGFFYNAFAMMLLSDPQLYQMTHGFHHSKVHTYEDAEFHPVGEVRNRAVRIIYNWLEVIIGVTWLVLMASLAVPLDPRFFQTIPDLEATHLDSCLGDHHGRDRIPRAPDFRGFARPDRRSVRCEHLAELLRAASIPTDRAR
jgi:fatty acid desaturase